MRKTAMRKPHIHHSPIMAFQPVDILIMATACHIAAYKWDEWVTDPKLTEIATKSSPEDFYELSNHLLDMLNVLEAQIERGHENETETPEYRA